MIPIDDVVIFDVITHVFATGAVSDADSAPTFEVFEEDTDTAILTAQTMTKRTSKTGNYRGSITWYSVVVSATVSSVSGKCVAKNFRVAPAESTAGVPKSDVQNISGSAVSTSTAQLGVNIVQAAATAWNSGAIGAATLATDTITAAKIAADAITDVKVASDVTIASVTGAVGSVTGTVGSVTGSVGSVTGAVGSVTGSVGSIATGGIAAASFAAGAINAAAIAADAITDAKVASDVTIASVTGSVGSVTGAVGSVTGAVGSIATGGISTASFAAGAINAAAIATGAIDADALATDAGTEIADAVLSRDIGSGTGAGTVNERTVRAALRFLRNKWTSSGGTLTVRKEDDTTSAWTATVATTAGNPVTEIDPV
jgi:hypothetical protein